MNKVLWLATTPDELELPIAVADTSGELARMLKIKTNTVIKIRYRMANGTRPVHYKIFKIEYKESVEDDI